jgi:hypothetical protein
VIFQAIHHPVRVLGNKVDGCTREVVGRECTPNTLLQTTEAEHTLTVWKSLFEHVVVHHVVLIETAGALAAVFATIVIVPSMR